MTPSTLNAAARRAKELVAAHRAAKRDDKVFVVMYTPSYERRAIAEGKDKNYYLDIMRSSATTNGFHLLTITSKNDLTSVFQNCKEGTIESIDYFGHANKSNFFLEYSSTPQTNGTHDSSGNPLSTPVKPHSSDYWGANDAGRVPRSQFTPTAVVDTYGCNCGDPGGIAEKLSQIWGVTTKGSVGKTDYTPIGQGQTFPTSNGGYQTFTP